MNWQNIDHVVLAVPDLQSGIDYVAAKTGCVATRGGIHPGRGTQNALLKIGPKQYLEILAPNPQEDIPGKWMGLDLITAPTISRWCIKSEHWENEVKYISEFKKELGENGSGERQKPDGAMLKWQLTYPHAEPIVELAPFVIDWGTEHPVDDLTAACSIVNLKFQSARPHRYADLFGQLNLGLHVEAGKMERIVLVLDTPNGEVCFGGYSNLGD